MSANETPSSSGTSLSLADLTCALDVVEASIMTEVRESVRQEVVGRSRRVEEDEFGDEGYIVGRGEAGRTDYEETSASARYASGRVNAAGESRTIVVSAIHKGVPKFDGSAEKFNSWHLRSKSFRGMEQCFSAFESDTDIPIERVQNDSIFASRLSRSATDRAIRAWSLLVASITDEDLSAHEFTSVRVQHERGPC